MWLFPAFHSSQLLCVTYLLNEDTILDLMATVFNTGKNEVADDEVKLKVCYKYWIFSLHHKLFVVKKHCSNIRQLNIMYL